MNHLPSPANPGSLRRADRTKQTILKERAKRLALEPAPAPLAGDAIEILEFALAEERYGVETSWVGEVYPLKDLTPVPGAPGFIRGLVNVRGRLIAVIDIKRFFDLPERGLTDLHRLIVVRNEDLEVGLLADRVVGVETVRVATLQSSLPTLTAVRREYLKGVTGQHLVVLDVAKLLVDPKLVVNEEFQP